jgi:hypothetical protein
MVIDHIDARKAVSLLIKGSMVGRIQPVVRCNYRDVIEDG